MTITREQRYPGNIVQPSNFHFTFTCRDRYAPSGLPERRELLVQGLSQLDAEVHLTQRLARESKTLHFMLSTQEVAV